MTISIRQVGPCFAGEVEGIDMRRPLTKDEVAAIHAGMDKYAVLVFRDQKIDDAQQLAFTQSLGEIEHAIGTSLRAASETRLPTTFADVSNLDKNNTPYPRDDRRRLFAIGNRLWHSDSLVQGGAGQVLAAARHQHPVEGRQHPVRRHARGLRCARRRDQGRGREHGVRAFADVLAPDHRLHRLHRRGARALPAGAPVHGAHPSGDRAASRSICRHMPAASSAGRCPRRAATCAT